MKETLEQKIFIEASAHEIYEALMDSELHTKFTGKKAHISRNIGGKYTTYEGYCIGTNIDLLPNKKIVQSWHALDWPDGYYSRVTFALEEKEGGTELTFTQDNLEPDDVKSKAEGWEEFYWQPLKRMLEKG